MRLYYRVMTLTAATLMATASPMSAHEHVSPDGRTVTWYESSCCNNDDCAPVTERRPFLDGTLMLNERGVETFVPKGYITRPSGDERWHTCVGKYSKNLLCVYEPAFTQRAHHLARVHD